MADVHGSPGAAAQMPQASTAGPAPVPYGGPDLSPEPPDYGVADVTWNLPGSDVMSGVAGNAVQESSYAHDMNAGLCTPYYGGAISPVAVPGAGPEGSDTVAATVAGAVTAAQDRYVAHMNDAAPQGAALGVQLGLPANSMDPAVGVQGTEGSYYDPPRDY